MSSSVYSDAILDVPSKVCDNGCKFGLVSLTARAT
jgi:hypothetical protein